MTRAVVQQLESLLNRSFDGENTQSLLANLNHVQAQDWDWLPSGGERSIRAVFEHAAIAKHIYADFLFSEHKRTWARVEAECHARAGVDTAALVEWAREGHARFMVGVASLFDADARDDDQGHGARDTKAEVIAVMIQHDCYHAGEINHLRSVHQQRDGLWG